MQGPDVVMRFELVSGWSADQFADLVKFLGGKLTKSLSGNTTLAVRCMFKRCNAAELHIDSAATLVPLSQLFGHESNEFGPKPELLEAQVSAFQLWCQRASQDVR